MMQEADSHPTDARREEKAAIQRKVIAKKLNSIRDNLSASNSRRRDLSKYNGFSKLEELESKENAKVNQRSVSRTPIKRSKTTDTPGKNAEKKKITTQKVKAVKKDKVKFEKPKIVRSKTVEDAPKKSSVKAPKKVVKKVKRTGQAKVIIKKSKSAVELPAATVEDDRPSARGSQSPERLNEEITIRIPARFKDDNMTPIKPLKGDISKSKTPGKGKKTVEKKKKVIKRTFTGINPLDEIPKFEKYQRRPPRQYSGANESNIERVRVEPVKKAPSLATPSGKKSRGNSSVE